MFEKAKLNSLGKKIIIEDGNKRTSTVSATFNINLIRNSVQDLEAKTPVLIKELLRGSKRNDFTTLKRKAGIYAFWWVGDSKELKMEIKEQNYKLKGPSDRKDLIPVKICDDWLNAATRNNNICLYVGKTTNLNQRISGHLRYTVEDIWTDKKGNCKTVKPFSFEKKPNTVSQLRIGLERIFQKHSLEYIKNHIAISWLELQDDENENNAVNRFYIEDKMVADLFPIFNVDVER